MKGKCLIFMCVTVLLLVGFIQVSMEATEEQEKVVQARIGIEITSDQGTTRDAKKLNRVKTEDFLRIYISPEFDPAYIYVMHEDLESVSLLYQGEYNQAPNNEGVILPLEEKSYRFDGKHSRERTTIICSLEPLPEIEEFFEAQEPSLEKWRELEQQLLKRSHLDLSDPASQPLSIAGRSRFPLSSGNEFVVKKYEFRVKE